MSRGSPDDDLRALLEEHLAALGPIHIRRMFGGLGVFLDGLMFGLVADGVLFLKADALDHARFEQEGSAPFAYDRSGGRTITMSYWRAPERLLDEPDELVTWCRLAHATARRADAAKADKPTSARGKRRQAQR